MVHFVVQLAVSAVLVAVVQGECPNACSGHGTCGNYDMCTCYTGYIGNDCSQKICPFGYAHVDSAKGDLDHDQAVTYDPTNALAVDDQLYPYGTSESYPAMAYVTTTAKTAGTFALTDVTLQTETGHYYMECSNKGLCDRTTGSCTCLTGYEGSACNRASCPNACSGNGICRTLRELAKYDYGNQYELWDADASQACVCDPGFYGYDCSLRQCPYGVDPLSYDNINTKRVPTWNLKFSDVDDTVALAGGAADSTGSWRLKFFDVFGQEWTTNPITFSAIATADMCTDITDALQELPASVVPTSSVTCSSTAGTEYDLYTLTFTENPGYHQVPKIWQYDFSGRHTLDSGSTTGTYGGMTTRVYDTGVTGEFYDYFGQYCNVILTATASATDQYGLAMTIALTPVSTGEALLKSCLGDSNGNWADNYANDINNYDVGSTVDLLGTTDVLGLNPHLIKLVPTTQSLSSRTESGVFAIIYWATLAGTPQFYLATAIVPATTFYVFATDGVLERVWYDSDKSGTFGFSVDEAGVAYFPQYSSTIYTSRDFSCENAGTSTISEVFYTSSSPNQNNCIQKGDYLVIPMSLWGDVAETVSGSAGTGASFGTGQTFTTAASYYGAADVNVITSAEDSTANLYQVKRIWVEEYGYNSTSSDDLFPDASGLDTYQLEDRYRIQLDRPIYWDGARTSVTNIDYVDATGAGATTAKKFGVVQFFKFMPNVTSKYTEEYVAPCSLRGLCDTSTGLCSCFSGYTNANCDLQNALVV